MDFFLRDLRVFLFFTILEPENFGFHDQGLPEFRIHISG